MSEGKYSSRLKILILMPYVHSGIFPSIITNNFEECIKILINTIFYLFVHFKDFIYLFLERGRVGEREGEKHQCVVASHVPPTGDLACNPGMCLDWESNRQLFGSQSSTQSTEPHQPEFHFAFLIKFLFETNPPYLQ